MTVLLLAGPLRGSPGPGLFAEPILLCNGPSAGRPNPAARGESVIDVDIENVDMVHGDTNEGLRGNEQSTKF